MLRRMIRQLGIIDGTHEKFLVVKVSHRVIHQSGELFFHLAALRLAFQVEAYELVDALEQRLMLGVEAGRMPIFIGTDAAFLFSIAILLSPERRVFPCEPGMAGLCPLL